MIKLNLKLFFANLTSVILVTLFTLIFTYSNTLAASATLSLSPSTGTFNRGCDFSLNIELDTGGAQTDGTDAIVNFEATKLKINSITNGTIYPDYPGNSIDNQTGRVNVSGLAAPDKAFSSKGTLATLNISVLANAPAGSTPVTFMFDPNNKTKTTDSNVVERSTIADVLSQVQDGNYTIGTGACGSSTGTGTGTGTVVQTGAGTGTGTGTGNVSGKGGLYGSTPSAELKQLPQSAITGPTLFLMIVGGTLTLLGIIGLALL